MNGDFRTLMAHTNTEAGVSIPDPEGGPLERLARIETKVDMLLERAQEDRNDFRGRLRALERWRYGTGAAVLMALAPILSSSLPKGS